MTEFKTPLCSGVLSISEDKTMLMTNVLCDAMIRNTNKEKFNNEDHLPFPSHVDII